MEHWVHFMCVDNVTKEKQKPLYYSYVCVWVCVLAFSLTFSGIILGENQTENFLPNYKNCSKQKYLRWTIKISIWS